MTSLLIIIYGLVPSLHIAFLKPVDSIARSITAVAVISTTFMNILSSWNPFKKVFPGGSVKIVQILIVPAHALAGFFLYIV